MSFKTFVKSVNSLSKKDCAKRNIPYKSAHVDYSQGLLKLYYKLGFSPQETLFEMEAENQGIIDAQSLNY